MAERMTSPVIWSQGVVMMAASGLCCRSRSTTSWSFSSLMSWVRERTMVPAVSIWSLKNSPKFFIYILHFLALTTATALPSSMGVVLLALPTARLTSLSLPTPEGSMMTRSGWYCSTTSWRARLKSPTREQQMQPEFISLIWMPESFKKPPSMPISPNSFSISTSFWPWKDSSSSFLIRVVLPAPRKPEIMSIVVIVAYLILA